MRFSGKVFRSLHQLCRDIKQKWIAPFRKNRARSALIRWAESCLGSRCAPQDLGGTARLTLRLNCGSKSYIAQYGSKKDRFALFIKLGEHLRRQGVRVPQILRHDLRCGNALLDDLGSANVASLLQKSPDAEKVLDEVMATLASFHAAAPDRPHDSRLVPLFDANTWIFHTMSRLPVALHDFCPHMPKTLFNEAEQELKRFCAAVAPEKGPLRLCHTDCHLGNILLKDDLMYVIDWEDAKICSPALDLAVFFMYANGPEVWPYRERCLARYLAESDLPPEAHGRILKQLEFFELGFLLQRMAQHMDKVRRSMTCWTRTVLHEKTASVLQRESMSAYPAVHAILRDAEAALRKCNGKTSADINCRCHA